MFCCFLQRSVPCLKETYLSVTSLTYLSVQVWNKHIFLPKSETNRSFCPSLKQRELSVEVWNKHIFLPLQVWNKHLSVKVWNKHIFLTKSEINIYICPSLKLTDLSVRVRNKQIFLPKSETNRIFCPKSETHTSFCPKSQTNWSFSLCISERNIKYKNVNLVSFWSTNLKFKDISCQVVYTVFISQRLKNKMKILKMVWNNILVPFRAIMWFVPYLESIFKILKKYICYIVLILNILKRTFSIGCCSKPF